MLFSRKLMHQVGALSKLSRRLFYMMPVTSRNLPPETGKE